MNLAVFELLPWFWNKSDIIIKRNQGLLYFCLCLTVSTSGLTSITLNLSLYTSVASGKLLNAFHRLSYRLFS